MTDYVAVVEVVDANTIVVTDATVAATVEINVGLRGVDGANGVDGIDGTNGADGVGSTTTAIASGAISGHTVVALSGVTAASASCNTPAHATIPIGVTMGAAINGDTVTVATSGAITEPTWSWAPGDLVYLGAGGSLTQVAPVAPSFIRVIGSAISATSLMVDTQPTIRQA